MNRFEQVHREIFLRRVRLAAWPKPREAIRDDEPRRLPIADCIRVLPLSEAAPTYFHEHGLLWQ